VLSVPDLNLGVYKVNAKYLCAKCTPISRYYHPSNGGSWTQSLERFLHHMVNNFLKRLAKEQRYLKNFHFLCFKCFPLTLILIDVSRERTSLPEIHSKMQFHLMNNERKTFVEAVTRLIERGKFSKNSSLARTAAMVSSSLAYIEPSLMLSSSISQFQTALDSVSL
jgi:proteasome activator subunit 4